MAKVKGPLMSMDARGQIGKSLVFLGWKGIKDVRSYVIPANPKTVAQVAQRSTMSTAVALWHASFLNALDQDAFRVLASIQASAMSGFNVFCKKVIDLINLEWTYGVVRAMSITANTGGSVAYSFTSDEIPAQTCRMGYSPTVMGILSNPAHGAPGSAFTGTLAGVEVGSDIYFQFYTNEDTYQFVSGIYKVRVLP